VTDYYQIPYESASGLKSILTSPKLYRYYRDNDTVETDPMRLGTAAHCAVLEPRLYNARFAIWSERADSGKMSPRSKNNSKWTGFLASNADREILTEDQDRDARAIASAVMAHPGAARLLEEGRAEVPIMWEHRGVACKSKLDWMHPDCIVDLKTTRSLATFASQAARARIPFQMAMYQAAVAYECEGSTPPARLIVVENQPPFDVAVFRVPEDTLAVGRRDMERAFDLLLHCRERNEWPGLGAEELELVLPAWADISDDEEWEVDVKEVA
jgi:hypothetical protein